MLGTEPFVNECDTCGLYMLLDALVVLFSLFLVEGKRMA